MSQGYLMMPKKVYKWAEVRIVDSNRTEVVLVQLHELYNGKNTKHEWIPVPFIEETLEMTSREYEKLKQKGE